MKENIANNRNYVKDFCDGMASRRGRVVFNIKGNDYRLVAQINRRACARGAHDYRAGTLEIRFFGGHAEYDGIDAETI